MSAYILSNCLEHQLIDDHYTRADWLAEGQPNLRVSCNFRPEVPYVGLSTKRKVKEIGPVPKYRVAETIFSLENWQF